MPNVIIDGVRYVPVGETIVNRDILLRALAENFWGSLGNIPPEEIEEKAKDLYIQVMDYGSDWTPLIDFVDSLGDR
jgi:hypothetical protein